MALLFCGRVGDNETGGAGGSGLSGAWNGGTGGNAGIRRSQDGYYDKAVRPKHISSSNFYLVPL